VLNVMRPPAGSSIAVFGTGAVGLSAVMATTLAGCTTIVGVDVRPGRLELARDLGATHVIDAGQHDVVPEIRRIAPPGVDFAVEPTGSPQVLRQAFDCTGPGGVCGVIGGPPFGTEVALDVNGIITLARTVRGIVEGGSVPSVFIPRLVQLWEQGRFPVERLMTFYDFNRIEEAVRDAEEGSTIKPVLRM
jgi:aryl-alcohol dehydrogenase